MPGRINFSAFRISDSAELIRESVPAFLSIFLIEARFPTP
jgi:hypothetical protein